MASSGTIILLMFKFSDHLTLNYLHKFFHLILLKNCLKLREFLSGEIPYKTDDIINRGEPLMWSVRSLKTAC